MEKVKSIMASYNKKAIEAKAVRKYKRENKWYSGWALFFWIIFFWPAAIIYMLIKFAEK